jgi:two-component system, OmpR family, response regulator MprA
MLEQIRRGRSTQSVHIGQPLTPLWAKIESERRFVLSFNPGLRLVGDDERQSIDGKGTGSVRIMIADDDAAIRESLERVLQVEGYDISTVANGLAVLDGVGGAGGDSLDLLILDVMMPRLGGLETCRRLRAAGQGLPVLMLTARDQVSDRVAGLDAGADDYLPKPFATEELLARVRALLRRRTPADGESQIMSFADVRLDPDRFEAWRGTRPLRLTRTEFSLLQVLVRNATRVLTRDALFEAIWGYDMSATANNLQVYVSYLRRKMEAEGEPRLIYTLRGLGYTLRETPP